MTTNLIYFSNKKQQKDNFVDEIISLGIIGDVAGQAIQNLNNEVLTELSGKRNSDLKNTLSIYEYTTDELLVFEKDSINTIERNGDHFYISGNYTNLADKSQIYSLLNIRLIKLFIHKEMEKFLDDIISRNFSDETIETEVENKLFDVAQKVRRYLKDFDYTVEKDTKGKVLYVNLYESYNNPISKINVNVRDIT